MKCDHGAHCVAGVCVCPKVCPESSGELVCGSDAKTYQSECELQRAACGRDPKLPALHVIFYGDCTERLAAAALSTLLKLYIHLLRRANFIYGDPYAVNPRQPATWYSETHQNFNDESITVKLAIERIFTLFTCILTLIYEISRTARLSRVTFSIRHF